MSNLMAAAAALWMLAMPQTDARIDRLSNILNGAGQTLSDPQPSLIAQKQLPEFLTSGDNDLIVIHQIEAGAPRPDIVQVCLLNRSRSGGRKAFDNHRTKQPRYVAGSNRMDCGQVHPTQQDFFFWKAKTNGALKPVLKQKLNLFGYAGYSIRLEWIDD